MLPTTNERGAYATRLLPDGRVLELYPLLVGRARLTLSAALASPGFLEGW